MKYINNYKIFENIQEKDHPGFPKTEVEIHRLCEEFEIENYTINDDLSIDVYDKVNLGFRLLTFIPLNFNYVSKDFSCAGNYLKSLKGSPKRIDKDFRIEMNNIYDLTFFPREVKGDILIKQNPIYSIIKILFVKNNLQELIQEFNDYNIIHDNEVILIRLKAFINDFGLIMPNLEEVKNYYRIV